MIKFVEDAPFPGFYGIDLSKDSGVVVTAGLMNIFQFGFGLVMLRATREGLPFQKEATPLDHARRLLEFILIELAMTNLFQTPGHPEGEIHIREEHFIGFLFAVHACLESTQHEMFDASFPFTAQQLMDAIKEHEESKRQPKPKPNRTTKEVQKLFLMNGEGKA